MVLYKMSDSSSSSSSDTSQNLWDLQLLDSSDNELDFGELQQRERPKNENYVHETVRRYNNKEYLEQFRISRNITELIVQEFAVSEYFNYQSGGNGKLEPLEQILIYLWFVGHQTSSFRDVADRFNIAISTLHKIIRNISYFLSNKSQHIIKWPTSEEKYEIERYFRENNFPGVIGCIDGSHIKIDRPTSDPDSYLNRKQYFSIQMQAVCDHQRIIRDIFIRFPGSVHDSRVFRASPLSAMLADNCGSAFILGDSGYPCLENLMTPYKDRGNLTRRQRNFNAKLSSNRYVIEHTFGLLKQKFRALYHIKVRNIRDIVHLIRACCVLHNLAIKDDFQEELPDNEPNIRDVLQNEITNDEDASRDDRGGLERRNSVANMLPL